MIIYGAMTKNSIVKLFMAGIIPGLILSALFMVYICIRVYMNPALTPKEEAIHPWQAKIAGWKDIIPILLNMI